MNVERAEIIAKEGLRLFEQLGPAGRLGLAQALQIRAEIKCIRGHLNEYENYTRRYYTIACELGEKALIALGLNDLANCARSRNQPDLAKQYYQQALALSRELGDREGEAGNLWSLELPSWLHDMDVNAAIGYDTAACEIFAEIGQQWQWRRCIRSLSFLTWLSGKRAEAVEMIRQNLIFARQHGCSELIQGSRATLGFFALHQGDDDAASQYYQELLAEARQNNQQEWLAGAYFGIGMCHWNNSQYDQAAQWFNQAASLFKTLNDHQDLATTLSCLGYMALKQGNLDTARDYMAEAYRIILKSNFGFDVGYQKDLLYGIAYLVVRQHMAQAALLLGATEKLYNYYTRHFMLPIEMNLRLDSLEQARAALGEAAFSSTWEEGKAMSMEQTLNYALKVVNTQT